MRLRSYRHGFCLLASAGLSTLLAAADTPEESPLFVSGEGGYHTYRIPSLITTPSKAGRGGTVLAFCEGRKNGAGDTGDIDLLLRRSLDGGRTWLPAQVVWDDSENTCGNPCPVVERETGAIWLLLTGNLRGDSEEKIVQQKSRGTRTVWVARSGDEGASWTKPIEITGRVKRPDWTWYATGPGVGIQLGSGRLVIPCDHQSDLGRNRGSHVIYSDDRGASWKLGGAVGPDCNESQVVERADGSLLLNMRSFRGNGVRLVANSSDGGLTWSQPAEDRALIEPVCQAGLLRVPGSRERILFSNPASRRREKMTVRLSEDGGRTWPFARVLHPGPSAYSCLAILPGGDAACLYERGRDRPYECITLARFPLAWLFSD